MACEKYSAWMTDASLGALAPGREPDLLAHAAECEACREAYQHARELAAMVDRGIESLVAGEPSQQFLPRLRARLAQEPAPARFHWAAWGAVAPAPARRLAPGGFRRLPVLATGALVLGVLVLVMLARSPRHNNPNPGVSVANQSEPSPPQAVAMKPPSQLTAAEPPRVARAHRAGRPAASHSREPEVLVEPGQLEAALQFADAVRSGRVNAVQLVAADEESSKPLEIKPLEELQTDTNHPPQSSEDSSSR